MASDPLLSSSYTEHEGPKGRKFKVWVKTYASGRIRVVMPGGTDGFRVQQILDGVTTPDLKVELVPAR